MPREIVLGWDLGGAHLKVAVAGRRGVAKVLQLPCPLWQGIERFDEAMAAALALLPQGGWHAVTMTGELADFFTDRARGVRALVKRFNRHVPALRTLVYAGYEGFLSPGNAAAAPDAVASANWAASAQLVAALHADALFVDIGSTTTDIVPIVGGIPVAAGYSDAARLACEELVYSGVVRTPVLALCERIPFGRARIRPMAELFATTADVYRLTGELPRGADQLPAADNAAKTVSASARRLARMIGHDAAAAPLDAWQRCARHLAAAQLDTLLQACVKVAARGKLPAGAPVVGAGVGSFLARKLARRLGRLYLPFGRLIGNRDNPWMSHCAPAVAVALLGQAHIESHARRQARR